MPLPTDSRMVLTVVGPTASGKSELAMRIAEHVGGEIVSADSMQIYRGMDIGTAKIPADERRVPHFGLDILDPGMPYSAALFQDYARACFADISARGKTPILAGGTGFYVRAAIDGYDFASGEQSGNPVRERYAALADAQGAEAVWEVLRQRDPASADVIHPHNVKRAIRALEMLEIDGASYAERARRLSNIPQVVDARIVYLHVDADVLHDRIDARVDAMFKAGLVEEVRGLCERGFREACTASGAIGYKEVAAAFDGDCTIAEAREAIKTASRRYAKRQRSWWRRDARAHVVDATDADFERILEEALRFFAGEGEVRP